MLTTDNSDRVITQKALQNEIKSLVQDLILFSLLDHCKLIPLCIILTLDTEPDFSLFKKKVSSILEKYKSWITKEREKKSPNTRQVITYPPLFDPRISENSWYDIKEIHALYHHKQITIFTNGKTMISRYKIRKHKNSETDLFQEKCVTINSNLKYYVQYIILKELLEQYRESLSTPNSTDQKKMLSKASTIKYALKRELLDRFYHYVQYYTFFLYGEYLKSLYDIHESYVIDFNISPLQITKGVVSRNHLKIIKNILDITYPILESGCDILIESDIPQHFSIFLETSDIRIIGTVYGTVFNKYGNITITSKNKCTGNIMSIFGTATINNSIHINKHSQFKLFIPKYFCNNVKLNSTMIRKTNQSKIERVIHSFSIEDIVNPNNPESITSIHIELQNPQIKYKAVIASREWRKTTTEGNSTSITTSTTFICDIINNINYLNTIDHISEDNRLPNRLFSNGIRQLSHYICVEDEKLIIKNLTKKLADYLTHATSNGTAFNSIKPKIQQIVIHNKTKEFVSLILHDIDVIINGNFCGALHTNAGNITIIGKVYNNSQISSNTGSIKILTPNDREFAVSDSCIKTRDRQAKIEINGQVSPSSKIEAADNTITNNAPSSSITRVFLSAFSRIFRK